jgi:hypothetical protein
MERSGQILNFLHQPSLIVTYRLHQWKVVTSQITVITLTRSYNTYLFKESIKNVTDPFTSSSHHPLSNETGYGQTYQVCIERMEKIKKKKPISEKSIFVKSLFMFGGG